MSATKKVVINECYGGFGLSEAAYAKLIEWGVPVRAYVEEQRNERTGRYERVPENEGEVIFDRDLDTNSDDLSRSLRQITGRYWETWTRNAREHPLVVRVVEELGAKANGNHAKLKIVAIPADVEYEVEEYDGFEHIAEAHRTWS